MSRAATEDQQAIAERLATTTYGDSGMGCLSSQPGTRMVVCHRGSVVGTLMARPVTPGATLSDRFFDVQWPSWLAGSTVWDLGELAIGPAYRRSPAFPLLVLSTGVEALRRRVPALVSCIRPRVLARIAAIVPCEQLPTGRDTARHRRAREDHPAFASGGTFVPCVIPLHTVRPLRDAGPFLWRAARVAVTRRSRPSVPR